MNMATANTTSIVDSDSNSNAIELLFEDNQLRFELELEFVSLLSNPYYLRSLAQNGYFDENNSNNILNYIKYLQYWHSPEYIIYLEHPHCLYFLEMLMNSSFRAALLDENYINLLHSQQYWHWRSFRYNRYIQAKQQQEQQQQVQG